MKTTKKEAAKKANNETTQAVNNNNKEAATKKNGKNAVKKEAAKKAAAKSAEQLTKKAALGQYKNSVKQTRTEAAAIKNERRSLLATVKIICRAETPEAAAWKSYFAFETPKAKEGYLELGQKLTDRLPWYAKEGRVEYDHDSRGNSVQHVVETGRRVPLYLGTETTKDDEGNIIETRPVWKERKDWLDVVRDIIIFELAQKTRTNVLAKIEEVKNEKDRGIVKRVEALKEELKKMPPEAYVHDEIWVK